MLLMGGEFRQVFTVQIYLQGCIDKFFSLGCSSVQLVRVLKWS